MEYNMYNFVSWRYKLYTLSKTQGGKMKFKTKNRYTRYKYDENTER